MSHHRRALTADAAPEAVGPYSHAVVSGGLVFCSGQVPLDPDTGELVEGGADVQATACLRNLDAVCRSAGTTLSDAVRLTVYLTDLASDWPAVNDVYASFFADADGLPARAAVGVAALPKNARVEMDAIVALPD